MIHNDVLRSVRYMLDISDTKMAQIVDTTLFIKNGPCMTGLGLGGEGTGRQPGGRRWQGRAG